MHHHVSPRRAASLAAAIAAFAVVGFSGAASAQPSTPLAAFSCFSVAEDVVCMDFAAGAAFPPMPPVIVPAAAWGEGESESIVIRDDGGRQVTRG
jgi:hypothetical protein